MADHSPETSEPQALSPVQTRVVVALAQGCSVAAAAETAGVHRTTIHRWLQDPVFDAAVKQTRDDYCETICDEFKSLTGLAVSKLRMLLESLNTPPSVVARVSLALLNRRNFPKQGWELAPMHDSGISPVSDGKDDDDDDDDDDASLENSSKSDALCSNLSHDRD
jgi:hypothetical protein